MNIIVCIKLVPSIMEVRMDQQFNMKRDSVVQVLNTADEAALEAALRLKEEGSVTVMTMGKQSAEEPLRSLLSRGADRAVLVSDPDFAGSDSYATAKTLAAAIRYLGDFDLILCGRRAIDGETGQVPPELAAILELPFITNCTAIRYHDNSMECSRLLEDGIEELKVNAPAVLTLCEYSYPLRPASIPGMRKAKQIPVMTLNRTLLRLEKSECGLPGSPTRVRNVTKRITGIRNVTVAENTKEGIAAIKKMLLEVKKQ